MKLAQLFPMACLLLAAFSLGCKASTDLASDLPSIKVERFKIATSRSGAVSEVVKQTDKPYLRFHISGGRAELDGTLKVQGEIIVRSQAGQMVVKTPFEILKEKQPARVSSFQHEMPLAISPFAPPGRYDIEVHLANGESKSQFRSFFTYQGKEYSPTPALAVTELQAGVASALWGIPNAMSDKVVGREVQDKEFAMVAPLSFQGAVGGLTLKEGGGRHTGTFTARASLVSSTGEVLATRAMPSFTVDEPFQPPLVPFDGWITPPASLKAGPYTLRIQVMDQSTKGLASADLEVATGEPTFGVSIYGLSLDEEGKQPIVGPIKRGEEYWLRVRCYGFKPDDSGNVWLELDSLRFSPDQKVYGKDEAFLVVRQVYKKKAPAFVDLVGSFVAEPEAPEGKAIGVLVLRDKLNKPIRLGENWFEFEVEPPMKDEF